jgi:hypothetical protein
MYRNLMSVLQDIILDVIHGQKCHKKKGSSSSCGGMDILNSR